MYLQVAGIEISPISSILFAFGISLVCSGAGVSGAFLLLPYQFTILGYTSPGVSATNQCFNILACPAGVLRYAKEGRFILPLALWITFGSIPGVMIGALARAGIFDGANQFRLFAALVLLYLGIRLLKRNRGVVERNNNGKDMGTASGETRGKEIHILWNGREWTVSKRGIFYASIITGLIGGIYGVGGGAMLSPILVSYFHLPLHILAGATLFGTFMTSIIGLCSYIIVANLLDMPQMMPDLTLGLLLGIGGIPGMYCGATLQKYMSPGLLKKILSVLIFGTAFFYIGQSLLVASG